MLRLFVLLIVIAVALLRGGKLHHFANLRLRWPALAIAGFAVQVLIFTPFASTPLVAWATVPLFLLSMTIVAVWVALNWRIPGMMLIGAGLLMNFAAIAANGGKMPVSPDALRVAGRYAEITATDPTISKHVLAGDATVRLWALTDVIGIPKGIPFASVWSIGDIALTLGVAILCYRTMCRPPEADAAANEQPAALADELG
jgi:hypothetical protein